MRGAVAETFHAHWATRRQPFRGRHGPDPDDAQTARAHPGAAARLSGAPPGGHRLPARHVIHAVGPVWRGGGHGEAVQLAACYRHSLALADQAGAATLAFPAISTGVNGYPLEAATRIAVATVHRHLKNHGRLREAIFCCFSVHDLAVYEVELARLPDAAV